MIRPYVQTGGFEHLYTEQIALCGAMVAYGESPQQVRQCGSHEPTLDTTCASRNTHG